MVKLRNYLVFYVPLQGKIYNVVALNNIILFTMVFSAVYKNSRFFCTSTINRFQIDII